MKKTILPPSEKTHVLRLSHGTDDLMMKNDGLLLEEEIRQTHARIWRRIAERLLDFRRIWEQGSNKDLFNELVFCLLTPSSRARSASLALEQLKQKDLLFNGSAEQIAEYLNIVRFRYKKSRFIVAARDRFFGNRTASLRQTLMGFESGFERRRWFAENISGIGYKEASHFLRNIGLEEKTAILDRHILRKMCSAGLLDSVPESLTGRQYVRVEKLFVDYSKRIGIPAAYLDFTLWFMATGDVYK
jgi:N-glycosylase/DNA lyase